MLYAVSGRCLYRWLDGVWVAGGCTPDGEGGACDGTPCGEGDASVCAPDGEGGASVVGDSAKTACCDNVPLARYFQHLPYFTPLH